MRRILAIGCSLSFLLGACTREDEVHLALDEASNGRTVALPLGEELSVTLASATDGGYSRWALAIPPDPAILESLGSHHRPGSGTPGDGGADVFRFRGVEAGQTSLVAAATRDFSGERITWSLTVIVGSGRGTVSGIVVGSGGLPVEGARVVIGGRPAVTTGADGRFVVEDVDSTYDALVGVRQPEFERAFGAAWLGLRRRDPLLALDDGWPQPGARRASVCGTASGDVNQGEFAPWVYVDPAAPFGMMPSTSRVDPSSRQYCATAGWFGPAEVAGSVHVLAVDSIRGEGSDFTATGFPAVGARGLAFVDGVPLTGEDVVLAPAEAASLAVVPAGPLATGANLFVAAYWGEHWLGAGVPLASQRSGPPWPTVAVPLLPDARIRVTAWSSGAGAGASWRERSLAPSEMAIAVALPAIPEPLAPPDGAPVAAGTKFRWAPAEADAAYCIGLSAEPSPSSLRTGFAICGSSPELVLPDFSVVDVAIPTSTTGGWEARSIGPAVDLDMLATRDHLGLALHHGVGETEWFTAVSGRVPVTFPP